MSIWFEILARIDFINLNLLFFFLFFFFFFFFVFIGQLNCAQIALFRPHRRFLSAIFINLTITAFNSQMNLVNS
jgi:hypothetical protein